MNFELHLEHLVIHTLFLQNEKTIYKGNVCFINRLLLERFVFNNVKQSGLDVDYEKRVDTFLKSGIQVDYNNILYFQLNRCFLALSMGNGSLIVNCVNTFASGLSGEEDDEYLKDIENAKGQQALLRQKHREALTIQKGISLDEYDKEDIERGCVKFFYGLKFQALIRLCRRLGIFGKRPIEEEIK